VTVSGRIMGNERERIYRFADFTLEVTEHRVKRRGRNIYLPPKTFEMLLYLVERPGRLALAP
jgi:DNA-binding response OmpR family regulator